jgi:PTS system nitrogen regulatory IIA component
LALVLRKELEQDLDRAGEKFEWEDIKRDLKALQETTIEDCGRQITVRSRAQGCCGKVFTATGIALPATIRAAWSPLCQIAEMWCQRKSGGPEISSTEGYSNQRKCRSWVKESVEMELTVNDIVKIFGIPERTVNSWIEKKDMPYIKVNEQYRFNYIALLDWALERKIKLTPEVLAMGDWEKNHSSVLYQAIKTGNIFYDTPGDNREEVLKSIVDVLPLPQKLNKESLLKMLIAREKMMTTAIGNGIAIPHVRNPVVLSIDQPSVTLCFLKNPVDFKALDRKPVFVVFTILSPSVKEHLVILSHLAFCLQNTRLQEYLHNKASGEQILAEIRVLESMTSLDNGNEKSENKI